MINDTIISVPLRQFHGDKVPLKPPIFILRLRSCTYEFISTDTAGTKCPAVFWVKDVIHNKINQLVYV